MHGIFNVCASAYSFVGLSVFSQNDRKGRSFASILLCLSEIVAMCLGFVDILGFVNVWYGFCRILNDLLMYGMGCKNIA